ncbi:MAG: diaminopimelate epimerase [Pseudomonadota bacterium]
MTLPFTKMHGLGNDFVVVDDRAGDLAGFASDDYRLLADRHLGIGCDQVLVIEEKEGAPAYRVYNADGSEVGQCGNGARCVARWLHDRGLIAAQATLGSAAGPIAVAVRDDGEVSVDMGQPRFAPADIPLLSEQPGPAHTISLADGSLQVYAVSMGNPHAVLLVDDVAGAPVDELGLALQSRPQFPERVNVGFAQRLGDDAIALRVYERGVGETQACGTGACAAVAALKAAGKLGPGEVAVHLPGGELRIAWPGNPAQVKMTGPAAYVFQGTYEPR